MDQERGIATRTFKPRDFPQISITGIEAIEEKDIAGNVTDVESVEALTGIKDVNEMSSRGGEASGAAASDPTETAGPRVSAGLPGSGRVWGSGFGVGR